VSLAVTLRTGPKDSGAPSGQPTVTTDAFTPSANARLLAIVQLNNDTTSSVPSVVSVTTAGLVWSRKVWKNKDAGSQGGAGTDGGVEIWETTTGAAPGSMTVAAATQRSAGGNVEAIISIVEITDSSGQVPVIGNVSASFSASGLPTVSVTTEAGSFAIAAASDWSAGGTGTYATGTTRIADGTRATQISWRVMRSTNPTAAGVTTLSMTAPSGQQYNAVIVEVRPPAAGTSHETASWQSSYTADGHAAAAWQSSYDVTGHETASWESLYTLGMAQGAAWSSSYAVHAHQTAGWVSGYSVSSHQAAGWESGYKVPQVVTVPMSDVAPSSLAVPGQGDSSHASASWTSSYDTHAHSSTSWQTSYTTARHVTATWTTAYGTAGHGIATWASEYTVSSPAGGTWQTSYKVNAHSIRAWRSSYSVGGAITSINYAGPLVLEIDPLVATLTVDPQQAALAVDSRQATLTTDAPVTALEVDA
jgi:hypothetical protein